MSAAQARTVVVLGGTGFLGRRVARALVASGYDVVTGTRAPEQAKDADRPIRIDLADPTSLERAFSKVFAVVNCIGLYVERGADTFQAVHVEGAGRVAEVAARQAVARLVHISGVNVDAASRSAYVRARAQGEEAVRAAFSAATILRPSAMFTEDAGFFAVLENVVRSAPVMPLFGDGATRLQPVHADDVAEAVVRVLASDAAPATTCELGGPDIMTYREIVERVAARAGLRRLLLPVPFPLWHALACAASALPSPPIVPGQVALMEHDNVASPGMPGFAELGITPRSASGLGLV